MQMRQRCDDFFDIPFNRKKWVFSAMLDNTFKVNKNLAFELMGNCLLYTSSGENIVGTPGCPSGRCRFQPHPVYSGFDAK